MRGNRDSDRTHGETPGRKKGGGGYLVMAQACEVRIKYHRITYFARNLVSCVVFRLAMTDNVDSLRRRHEDNNSANQARSKTAV